MLHNIEKSAFRAGEYVGYAAGAMWRIRRCAPNKGLWIATAYDTKSSSICRFTLRAISIELERLNKAFFASK